MQATHGDDEGGGRTAGRRAQADQDLPAVLPRAPTPTASAPACAAGRPQSPVEPQDLLPVLASRDVAVTDRLDRMFPETTTTRLRGVSDEAGWTEGTEAADRAQVRHRPPLR